MVVAVVVPWRPGCEHRETAWSWVRRRWAVEHPDWEIVEGLHRELQWCKAEAVARALDRTDADVLVVADADVWCDRVGLAVDQVTQGRVRWAVPHRNVHRLTPESTLEVLAGADPAASCLEQPPYRGWLGGGIVVLTRALYNESPLDRRFVGWGHEDESWARALRALAGDPWRGRAPLWHLWHPPQPRASRRRGSAENMALRDRYIAAGRRSIAMRALLAESRGEA